MAAVISDLAALFWLNDGKGRQIRFDSVVFLLLSFGFLLFVRKPEWERTN